MMQMEVFQKEVARLVSEKVKGKVSIEEITKNNGVTRIGLIISEETCNVSPTIYLEEYLKAYRQHQSMGQVVEDIVRVYEANRIPKILNVEHMMSYKNCKNCIFAKLISRERNRMLLNGVPWTPYLDMAVVYYIELTSENGIAGTVLIRNGILDYIGISKKELEEIALKNLLKRKSFCVTDMCDALKPSVSESFIEECMERNWMYVATNEEGVYGAIAILRKDIMKQIADRLDGDVLIFPSSVHEILCMRYENDVCLDEIKDMVREINATQLLPEEYLSDSVYIYKRAINEVIMV